MATSQDQCEVDEAIFLLLGTHCRYHSCHGLTYHLTKAWIGPFPHKKIEFTNNAGSWCVQRALVLLYKSTAKTSTWRVVSWCICCAARKWLTSRNAGMTCFKMTIHEVVKADVRCAVLDLIQQEREGGTVEHGLLKRIVEVSSTSMKGCKIPILRSS